MAEKIDLEAILAKHYDLLFPAYSVKDKEGKFTTVVSKRGALKAMREACEAMAEASSKKADIGPWAYESVEDLKETILNTKELITDGYEND
jgi:hypothetical protein